MAASCSHTDLREKLSSGEYYLSDATGKSDVWERFKLVVEKQSETNTGFVQCEKCLSFYSYNASKSGTSHLKRHNCSGKKSEKLTQYFKNESRSIGKDDRENILKACVNMCCMDLRPFDIVTGKGFISFTQRLVNIGAKYGSIDVDAANILPHPTTISRHICETANTLRNELIPILNKKIQEGCCAASTDMWTDDFKKISYTSVTMHYLDEDWKLINNLFFTCDFPIDERKTGLNIRKELINRFSKYGLSSDAIEKITFVTDRGANIISALQPYKRMDCCAHIINTVLRNLFQTDYLKENNSKVFETLVGSKSLVTFFKQSGLINRLTKTVHQDSETRWNSKLEMLESVQTMYDEISEILTEREEQNRLDFIHQDVLAEMIQFLVPFREASLALEKENEITLPFVMLWKKKLLSKCDANPTDENFMKDLKSRGKNLLAEKFIIKDEHKIATFLCPSFRKLKMLDNTEKQDVMIVIKNLIENFDTKSTESPTQTGGHAIKKQKLEETFTEFEDEKDDELCKDEIDLYYSLKLPSNHKELNIWWKTHHLQLPKLSKLAQKILCVPATSASSERSFSAAGFLMNERRTRLNPEIVDASLFLHNNL